MFTLYSINIFILNVFEFQETRKRRPWLFNYDEVAFFPFLKFYLFLSKLARRLRLAIGTTFFYRNLTIDPKAMVVTKAILEGTITVEFL